MSDVLRPRLIEVRAFHPDAEAIGEAVRANVAVLLDVSQASPDAKRRLTDFASGACYSRRWTMARVGTVGFLLSPPTETPLTTPS